MTKVEDVTKKMLKVIEETKPWDLWKAFEKLDEEEISSGTDSKEIWQAAREVRRELNIRLDECNKDGHPNECIGFTAIFIRDHCQLPLDN